MACFNHNECQRHSGARAGISKQSEKGSRKGAFLSFEKSQYFFYCYLFIKFKLVLKTIVKFVKKFQAFT